MEVPNTSVSGSQEDLFKQLTVVITSNIRKISLCESLMSTALIKIQKGDNSASVINELKYINKSSEMLVNETHDKFFNLMELKQINSAQEEYRIVLKNDYMQALDKFEVTRIAAAATEVEGDTVDVLNGNSSSPFNCSYDAYLQRREIERQKRHLFKLWIARELEKIKEELKESQLESPESATDVNVQYEDFVLKYDHCDLEKLVQVVSNKNVVREKMIKICCIFLCLVFILSCILLIIYMFG